MRLVTAALTLALAWPATAQPSGISGPASGTDGDTIRVLGIAIRQLGVGRDCPRVRSTAAIYSPEGVTFACHSLSEKHALTRLGACVLSAVLGPILGSEI